VAVRQWQCGSVFDWQWQHDSGSVTVCVWQCVYVAVCVCVAVCVRSRDGSDDHPPADPRDASAVATGSGVAWQLPVSCFDSGSIS
jgi:hypothetical protein